MLSVRSLYAQDTLTDEQKIRMNRLLDSLLHYPLFDYTLKDFGKSNTSRETSPSVWTPRTVPSTTSNRPATTVCYDSSGFYYLKNDTSQFRVGNLIRHKLDSSLYFCGSARTIFGVNNFTTRGLLGKLDPNGNLLWYKFIDSLNPVRFQNSGYEKIVQLRDGSMVLFGYMPNPSGIGYFDMLLTRVDMNGTVIWTKRYYSLYWPPQYNNYSAVGFVNADQDLNSNDIFASYRQQNGAIVARVDYNTGDFIWSKKYGIWAPIPIHGVKATPSVLKMYGTQGVSNSLYSFFIIDINPATGDTITSKSRLVTVGQPFNDYGLFYSFSSRILNELDNGHVVLTGGARGLTPMPGLNDPIVTMYLEYDENDSVVASRYLTAVGDSLDDFHFAYKIYPDSQAIMQTSLHADEFNWNEWEITTYNFSGSQVLQERKKASHNETFVSFGDVERMPNNGILHLSAATLQGDVLSCFRFMLTHSSDSSSECLGLYQSTIRTDTFNLTPTTRRVFFDSGLFNNYFVSSGPLTYRSRLMGGLTRIPGCSMVSFCDTIKLIASRDTVCGQSAWQIRVRRNPECGTDPTWTYDQSAIQSFTQIDDSTYSVQFNGAWNGWIHASLEGCTLMRDSLHVVVIPDTLSLNLGPDLEICSGNSIQLSAPSGFAQYHWQDGSSLPTFTVTQAGTYYLTALSSCGSQYSDTVHVVPHTAPAFQLAADSIRICRGDTTSISAPAGFSQYQWTPNQQISSINTSTVQVYPGSSLYYHVSAEDVPGCRVSDSVYVEVRQVPAIQLGQDLSFCTGDSATFSAGTGFAQVQWSTGPQSPQITVFQAGTYSVIGTAGNGCKAYDTIKVLNVYPLPTVDLGSDSIICVGSPRILHAGNFNQVTWNTGETGPSILVTDTGHYTVQVEDIHGCRGRDSIWISLKIIPPSQFLPGDTSICRSNDKIVISASGNYHEYLWNNQSTSNQITITSPGTYWLEVKDDYRCKGRDTININPKDCKSGFYVPSVFTPDNNGLNDLFKPTVYGTLNEYEMFVYNRWGQLLFHTKQIQDGWNGKFKGMPQNVGAYSWICVYRLNGGKQTRLSGTVLLIR